MAYPSQIEQLAKMRARGQRPDMPVVVGSRAAERWAKANRFFFVPTAEVTENNSAAFAGLYVLFREGRLMQAEWDAAQLLAFSAKMVTVNAADRETQFLVAA